jgi:hypothetical protein
MKTEGQFFKDPGTHTDMMSCIPSHSASQVSDPLPALLVQALNSQRVSLGDLALQGLHAEEQGCLMDLVWRTSIFFSHAE